MDVIKKTEEYSIIGNSQGIRDVLNIVGKAASSDSTVMIFGESGTGKELIARALHQNSERKNKPFIAVNHLEGHALSPKINKKIEFPYLLLLISGGHSQFLEVNGVNKYKRLGTTIDDALGEAFDKTAKLLGIEFPGGPKIEKWAKKVCSSPHRASSRHRI